MQLLQDNPDRHFLNAVMPAEVVRLYERSVKVRGSDGSAMKGISASCQKTLPDEIMLELRDCQSPFTNAYMYQSCSQSKWKKTADSGQGSPAVNTKAVKGMTDGCAGP